MQVLHKALGLLGIRSGKGNQEPDYQGMMRQALDRISGARRMLQEAGTLEQLDLARSDLQVAQAQIQHLLRQAKRERGITLRTVAETEEIYRQMRAYMNGQESERPGPNRDGRTGS